MAGKLPAALDHCHPRTEAAHRLPQFEAHVSATQDDQVVGQAVEVEGFNVRERLGRSKAGDVGQGGASAEVEKYSLARWDEKVDPRSRMALS